jgi:DNA polymerase zeta
MSIEVFAASRGKLLPDPLHDQVNSIFYSVKAREGPNGERKEELGVLLQQGDYISASNFRFDSDSSVSIEYAASERELLERLETLVHRWDPDFLTGFEVQKGSLGYLVDRASQIGVRSCLPSLHDAIELIDDCFHGVG